MNSSEVDTKPSADTGEELNVEDVIRRIEALVMRTPGVLGLLTQFVDLIDEVDLDERVVNQIEILCDFCFRYPELALHMAAIGTMRQ